MSVSAELKALYKQYGALRPEVVVRWAKAHKSSALHGKFQWDNTKAAHQYRLWQARELIVTVEVTYPDQKKRQEYVSLVTERRPSKSNPNQPVGYTALVDVLSDKQRRENFLAQALFDYERVGERYRDLTELAGVREEVRLVRSRTNRKSKTG